tara:strand:- start:627 stop:1025 length:399 start_codon:yes stop_codon:yes gene_type:complete
MATTFQYKVSSLKTNPSDDGYITEATVQIFGTEGSVTKSTHCHCVFPGNKAAVGSGFKSLDDLKKAEGEATIVEWAKAGWTDYKVKKLEASVQRAIDDQNSKASEVLINAEDTSYAAAPAVTPDPNAGAPAA